MKSLGSYLKHETTVAMNVNPHTLPPDVSAKLMDTVYGQEYNFIDLFVVERRKQKPRKLFTGGQHGLRRKNEA